MNVVLHGKWCSKPLICFLGCRKNMFYEFIIFQIETSSFLDGILNNKITFDVGFYKCNLHTFFLQHHKGKQITNTKHRYCVGYSCYSIWIILDIENDNAYHIICPEMYTLYFCKVHFVYWWIMLSRIGQRIYKIC